MVRSCSFGVTQEKLAASLTSPAPLYFACAGYGQTGRDRTSAPLANLVATIFSGATPSSTHLIAALTTWCSAWRYAAGGSGAPPPTELGPVLPPQWATAGSRKRR